MKENEIRAEDISLAPPTDLFEEAKKIAETTANEDKFIFILQYDANQIDFLMSVLKAVGAEVILFNEEAYTLDAFMNMKQLAFVKPLDCIERVSTHEELKTAISDEESVTETIAAEPLMANTMLVRSAEVATASVGSRCSGSSCSTPTNTTMSTAKEVSVGSSTTGRFYCSSAQLWYKFVVPETKQYTICTTGTRDTVGELYDHCGNLIERVDDREECGKVNFRILRTLQANQTYYVKVTEAKSNTGIFYLKVTEEILVDSVSINDTFISLDHIGKIYELPILPNTFTGVDGAEPLNNLWATVNPSTANEKRIEWVSSHDEVLEVNCGWHNGQEYQTAKVMRKGTARLYATDRDQNGKEAICTVCVGEGWPECEQPTIHSRLSWRARSVDESRLKPRQKAPELLIFHHTAENFTSTNIDDITAEIRRVQNLHMDNREKCDIAYHFIIDPAGGIWQGAMIDEYQRGHANEHFDDIGIVLLGNFQKPLGIENSYTNTLNNNQKNAMKELSKWLCYKYNLPINKFNEVSPITTHKEASGGTVCPGNNVIPWIEDTLKNYINEWYP